MNPSIDCKTCVEHSGFKARIEELKDFKDKMTNGTIERLWSAIDKKATKAMMITIIIIILSFVGTLFGLVYRSQSQILDSVSTIKSEIAVIKEKIK